MAKKKEAPKPTRTCAECVHEYACQTWTHGTIHNMDATNCAIYETVKDTASYLIGKLDGHNEAIKKKHDEETIREALMRLSMCARKECEICKYKDRPKAELPSDDCKERATKNMNILADVCLRGEK